MFVIYRILIKKTKYFNKIFGRLSVAGGVLATALYLKSHNMMVFLKIFELPPSLIDLSYTETET